MIHCQFLMYTCSSFLSVMFFLRFLQVHIGETFKNELFILILFFLFFNLFILILFFLIFSHKWWMGLFFSLICDTLVWTRRDYLSHYQEFYEEVFSAERVLMVFSPSLPLSLLYFSLFLPSQHCQWSQSHHVLTKSHFTTRLTVLNHKDYVCVH